jgi:hypothetical protein
MLGLAICLDKVNEKYLGWPVFQEVSRESIANIDAVLPVATHHSSVRGNKPAI